MFIVDYLYLTPSVYQKALERSQQKCEYDKMTGSTLIYNDNSHYLTNLLYSDMLHTRYFFYKMTKCVIELLNN